MKLCTTTTLALLFLVPLGGAAEPQAPPSTDALAPQPYKISVNVSLVLLTATVRDRQGRVAYGLREQDFEVYEDGVRQSIRLFRHDDIPVTVGLVIDHSGSMKSKITDVIAAARIFVQSSSPADQMFVVNFNDRVTLGLPVAVLFSDRPDELARAISNTPAEGMTTLYDAIVKAHGRLQEGSRDKKVLVVISDGGDNASAHSIADVLKLSEQASAQVFTVGIFDAEDPDRNPGILKRLAQTTGGEAFFPSRIDQVVAVCEGIARDIRSQYTLGYVSTNSSQTGAFRAIKVLARAPGTGKLSVRTRSGYVSAASAK